MPIAAAGEETSGVLLLLLALATPLMEIVTNIPLLLCVVVGRYRRPCCYRRCRETPCGRSALIIAAAAAGAGRFTDSCISTGIASTFVRE